MRIGHIVHQAAPRHIGGVELVTERLAAAQRALGHDARTLARSADASTTAALTAIQPPPSARGRYLATFGDAHARGAFDAWLEQTAPDIVHVQHLMGFPANALDALRVRGVPFVVTLHDYWFACANAQLITNFDNTACTGPGAYRCARCVVARAGISGALSALAAPLALPLTLRRKRLLAPWLAHAAAVTAPSRFVLRRFAEMGIDTHGWLTVPYGLSGAPLPPRVTNELRVLYVGGLSPQKGAHVLIDAFNTLPNSARLTIAGPLDAFPEYVAGLRKRALHPGISFIGPQPREAVWGLLAESDALVAPSTWPETFMLVVHEALAAGCAVIGSDIGAISEALRDKPNATLVRPNDAGALSDALHALKKRARAPQPFRSDADYARDMLALYDRALA
jgi:glycosyltransferase involved in cell wall biosynthesis